MEIDFSKLNTKCYEKFQDISLLYCKTIVVQFCKKFSRTFDFKLISKYIDD